MKILMLGNSATFSNRMPETLQALLSAEVLYLTKRKARLSDFLDSGSELGRNARVLLHRKWDYVVLQEFSLLPVLDKNTFMSSLETICNIVQANNATPVLFATWAYHPNCKKLKELSLNCTSMYQSTSAAYHEAGRKNHALVADVGRVFYEMGFPEILYESDGAHPSKTGSRIAAETIAKIIENNLKRL